MVAAVLNRRSRAGGTCQPLTSPLATVLDELREVLASLTDDTYGLRMGATFANATMGGHVRHCLDHVRALVDGWRAGIIDYDHRERGTDIETDAPAAIAEVNALRAALERMTEADADELVSVAVLPTRQGTPVALASTLARELAFVLSHTIHHNATIRGMAVASGVSVPENFGYAPSTLAHKDRCACAQ